MQFQSNGRKMDREEFKDELCQQLLEILGVEYFTEISHVRKNNGVLKEVLHVKKENSECVPCFYMDELFSSYQRGDCETALAEYLANIVKGECERVKKNMEQQLSKEWIEEHMFLRLVNMEKNRAFLENAVYTQFHDLAAVFYVLTEDNDDGVKSFSVPKRVWDTLELGTADEYFPRILENTERLFPAEAACMDEVLHGIAAVNDKSNVTDLLLRDSGELSKRMYVLSNRKKINGAAALMYPGALKRVSDIFQGNLYIIPSSIHEVLLLGESEECDKEQLNGMVREVNEQQVLPEEVLSDHIYFYSRVEDCIISM